MNLPASLLESPLVHRLGWVLVHSLWQGLAIALLLWIALVILRTRSASSRYLAGCAAMLAMAVLPVITFMRTPVPSGHPVAMGRPTAHTFQPQRGSESPLVEMIAVRPESKADAQIEHPAHAPMLQDSVPSRIRASHTDKPAMSLAIIERRALDWLSGAMPWLVLVWLAGVVLMSARNLGAWVAVQQLKSLTTRPVANAVEELAATLARRLGLSRHVRLLQSALIDSPLVIGMLKPAILLPASVLTELPVAHLEALLAHELAHVLRHDYFVNLLQSAVETLLFYHPAAWWISARIRAERENCCDDLAVCVTRDRATYVRALASVAGAKVPALAPAATGGELLPRLRRLLGKPDADAARSSRWLAGAIAVTVCIGMLAAGWHRRADAAEPQAKNSGPLPATRPALAAQVASSGEVFVHDSSAQGTMEINGRVIDPQGNAVNNAKVFLGNNFLHAIMPVKDATWNGGWSSPAYTMTDDQGRFTFNHLFSGHSDLWVESAAGSGWVQKIDTGTNGVSITVQPQGNEIALEGTIRDAQSLPLAGAQILLAAEVNNEWKIVFRTTTDRAGIYRLKATPPFAHRRSLELVCVQNDRAVGWREVPYISSRDINIQLKPMAAAHGRVKSMENQTVSGAKISAEGIVDPDFGNMDTHGELRAFAPVATTDAGGNYKIEGIPLGSRSMILARALDLAVARTPWSEIREIVQAVPEIRMPNGIVIEGTVSRASDKQPIAGATVKISYPTTPEETTTTDKNGRYRFTDITAFDNHSQRTVHAEFGGSPPRWEGIASYEKPLGAGGQASLDIVLERSLSSQRVEWEKTRGLARESRFNVAILDDADPAWSEKSHYDDTIGVIDSLGKQIWKKSGLNTTQDIGGNHKTAADMNTGALWVTELAGGRLFRFGNSGAIEWEKPNVKGQAIALDPKTGNAWVVTATGIIYGEGLVVFSPTGEKLQQFDVKGHDIVYSPHDDCFWLAGKGLVKVSRDGNVLDDSKNLFPWVGVSISANAVDGSIWVAEGRHPNVTDSRGQIWVFDRFGNQSKTFTVGHDNRCVEVDAAHNAAWIATSNRGLIKVDLAGKVLAQVPLGAMSVTLEPDTGYIWGVGWREGLWRLDGDGKPVLHQDTGESQKYLCIVPN